MNPENLPRQESPMPSNSSMEDASLPGEQTIYVLRKHPFGIFVMYIQAILGFSIVSVLLLVLLPDVAEAGQADRVKALVSVGLVLFGLVLALIMVLVTYIYRQNKLILTNRNVTQITQNGLFAHQVAELDLNDIEDVTADKSGFFPVILNFGMLRIETAGEKNYFHFTYCPNPDKYGEQLLQARDYCRHHSHEDRP